LIVSACDDPKPAAATDPGSAPSRIETGRIETGRIETGRIDIAVGDEVRAFGLNKAECEVVDAGGVRVLSIVAPAAEIHTIEGVRTRPDLLTAHLPADLGRQEVTFEPSDTSLGAIATVAGAEYNGDEYPLLQIIAQSVRDGADGYECRASRTADEISVVCNGAKVFPWAAPGIVPNGSFKARVHCKNDNGNGNGN
jgi:hypothetical protein